MRTGNEKEGRESFVLPRALLARRSRMGTVLSKQVQFPLFKEPSPNFILFFMRNKLTENTHMINDGKLICYLTYFLRLYVTNYIPNTMHYIDYKSLNIQSFTFIRWQVVNNRQ